MDSLKLYIIILAATLLAAGSYFVAWVNIQEIKSKEVNRVHKIADIVTLVDSYKEADEVSVSSVVMTQNEVSQTMEATSLAKEQLFASLPTWRKNSNVIKLEENKNYIAIIIDDVGVVEDRSLRSIKELPVEITLSFLPYGESTIELSRLAKKLGHEIMIHLPMQPKLSSDGHIINPGENALYTHLKIDEIHTIVEENFKDLAAISVGVNNHMGSMFTEWEEGLEEVFKVIEKNELIFLDSLTTPKSVASKAVQIYDVPFLKRDVFLDHEIEKDTILKALEKTERIAKAQGFAIAIGHPHNETTDVIIAWAETLANKNIQLVPITALIKRNSNGR